MNSKRNPKDHPAALYKYCHPDRVDILEGLKIRFTQPAVFNDIFEAVPGAAAPMDEDHYTMASAMSAGRIIAENPQWDRRQRRAFQREEFRQYKARVKSERKKSSAERLCEEFQIRYSAIAGALCVSGRGDNILMWSHYCQDHRGFTIEFDGMHSFFDGIVQVKYSDARPLMNPGRDGWNEPSVFYTKSSDWAYEDEFRKFHYFGKSETLKNGNKFHEFPPLSEIDRNNWPVRLVDLPAESIRRVILGYRIAAPTKARIFKALKADALKHVGCTQASPHPRLFKMEHSVITHRNV